MDFFGLIFFVVDKKTCQRGHPPLWHCGRGKYPICLGSLLQASLVSTGSGVELSPLTPFWVTGVFPGYRIVEVNARLSRSSALASKALGGKVHDSLRNGSKLLGVEGYWISFGICCSQDCVRLGKLSCWDWHGSFRLENECLYCSTSLVFDNLQGYVLECGWVEDEITGRGRTKEVGMNPRNPRRRK